MASPVHQKKNPKPSPTSIRIFMQQLGGWSRNEAELDLRDLLNQNFLCYNGKEPVPEQITCLPSQLTGRSCAICRRMLRLWLPRPATAGMCPTPTRQAIWRNCARRLCSKSSRNTKKSQEEAQSLPPGGRPRRVQESLAGTRLCRNHHCG